MKTAEPLLRVENLRVHFPLEEGVIRAVDGVDFTIDPGERLGVGGESGCGKTMTALAIMRLLPEGGEILGGSRIVFDGDDVLSMSARQLRRMRGGAVAMVPQDPMESWNPLYTMRHQMVETILFHRERLDLGRRKASSLAEEIIFDLLRIVEIPNPDLLLKSYPHQLSGGMRQRASIAMALSCKPKLVIADEPTTALDVTIQAGIIDLLKKQTDNHDAAVMLITHDLGVLASFCDRLQIMYAGRIVERGPIEELYDSPAHPYMRMLLKSNTRFDAPNLERRLPVIPGELPNPAALPDGCTFAPRCPRATELCRKEEPAVVRIAFGREAECHYASEVYVNGLPEVVGQGALRKSFGGRKDSSDLLVVDGVKKHFPIFRQGVLRKRVDRHVLAVDGVSLSIAEGETLALVGESGCGKTTLAHAILRLCQLTAGSVSFAERDIHTLPDREMQALRSDLQVVFQNPDSSLNPTMSVSKILSEPMRIRGERNRGALAHEVERLLTMVYLPVSAGVRRPHEFSGGQKQRIGIARALALSPKLVVLDEPVSALDVSTRAQVLNLLDELQEKFGLAYLFISHDLSVVRYMADRVAVMYLGKIMEAGSAERIFSTPEHPYTHALLSAVPLSDPAVERRRERIVLPGDPPSPDRPPQGCVFSNRCPIRKGRAVCVEHAPEIRCGADGHVVACHFPEETRELPTFK